MKIAILTQKGLDELVRERLADLPITEALDQLCPPTFRKLKLRVEIAPPTTTYVHESGGSCIDILTDFDHTPSGFVVGNRDEYNEVKNNDYYQHQLIFFGGQLYVRLLHHWLKEKGMFSHYDYIAHFVIHHGRSTYNPYDHIWKVVAQEMVGQIRGLASTNYPSSFHPVKIMCDADGAYNTIIPILDNLGFKELK